MPPAPNIKYSKIVETMIKLHSDNECISSKVGHKRFIKKLNQILTHGATCNLCYLCGNKCHEIFDEKFITLV